MMSGDDPNQLSEHRHVAHTHTDIYIYINILLQASIDGSKPFKITIILTYIKHIFWNNP